MKRYSMEIDTPNRIVIIPYEDENGEWVRYEDVKKLIEIGNELSEALRSEVSAKYAGKLDFPVMKRKMEQDMASIKKWNSKGGGMKRYILAQWDGDLVMVSTDRESVVYPQNTDVEWVRYTDTQKVCEWKVALIGQRLFVSYTEQGFKDAYEYLASKGVHDIPLEVERIINKVSTLRSADRDLVVLMNELIKKEEGTDEQ